MASSIKKTQKYDRQLRLWGDHGQNALESGAVCLINASATGTEILKNIILPGIGSFMIVDGAKVTEADLGNNFFFSQEHLGQNRAKVASELLRELNQDVQGDYVCESLSALLERDPGFFSPFTVVIATGLAEQETLRLGALLWEKRIPLVLARALGMVGYARIVAPEACVIESHPDFFIPDLRLAKPFPELQALADKLDFEKLTLAQHSHVPWALIILKALNEWRAENGNRIPKTSAEKEQIVTIIKSKIRQREDREKYRQLLQGNGTVAQTESKKMDIEGDEESLAGIPQTGPEDEINFEEALKNIRTTLQPPSVPSEVREILDDPRAANTDLETPNFWILARCLREFVEAHGVLPVSGTIPDMTSDSDSYVTLQQVYVNKAREDAAVITGRAQELLASIGRPLESLPEAEIKLFCRNAAFLMYTKGTSLAQEYDTGNSFLKENEWQLESDNSLLVFYILLRAVDRFVTAKGHYPGIFEEQLEEDVGHLSTTVSALLSEWGLAANIKDEYISEVCRWGGAELHAVAAFVGGVAAQEVIKLITRQYVPLNNTFIFNGITASSAQFKL